MSLQLNVKLRSQYNCEPKQKDRLPRKPRLTAPFLGRGVRLNQGTPNGPLAELIRRKACQN